MTVTDRYKFLVVDLLSSLSLSNPIPIFILFSSFFLSLLEMINNNNNKSTRHHFQLIKIRANELYSSTEIGCMYTCINFNFSHINCFFDSFQNLDKLSLIKTSSSLSFCLVGLHLIFEISFLLCLVWFEFGFCLLLEMWWKKLGIETQNKLCTESPLLFLCINYIQPNWIDNECWMDSSERSSDTMPKNTHFVVFFSWIKQKKKT